MRVLGSAVGVGFLALGAAALAGGARAGVERAIGLGLAALVAGVVAVLGSLLVADPHGIW
jgi:hypothetical protein